MRVFAKCAKLANVIITGPNAVLLAFTTALCAQSAALFESASLPRLTGCKLDGMSHCKTSITAFHVFCQLHYLACLRLSALLCTNLSRTSKQMLVQTPLTGLQGSSSAARLDHSCHNVLVSRCMEDS